MGKLLITNFELMSLFLTIEFFALDFLRQQQQHKLAMSSIIKMNMAEQPMAINVIYVEKSELKS
jgi:hypothetical protein